MKKNALMILSTLFVVSVSASLVRADTVTRTVGNKPIDFVIPKGQCLLEDSNPNDFKFINVVRTLLRGASNTLFVTTVECSIRARLRRGEGGNVLNYVTFYTPNASVDANIPGETASLRKDLCNDMRKQGDATLADVGDIVAKSAKELKANIAVNSTKYIGVIDEDEHGCYAALLIGVAGADGKNIMMSSVVTATVINGKALFSGLYNEYEGPETTADGVAAAKVTAAEFDRKNR